MRKPILFLAIISFSACAHIPGAPGKRATFASGSSGKLPAATVAPESAKGAKLIQISESDPLRSLETQIEGVKTEKVIIPTRLLRTLMAAQKGAPNECRDLSLQLEALKNIDLEETSTASEVE